MGHKTSGGTLYGRDTRPKLRGAAGSDKKRQVRNCDREAERKYHENRRVRRGFPLMSCLECGARLRTMSSHLRHVHKMTTKEYITRFNLPQGFKMCAPDLVNTFRRNVYKRGGIPSIPLEERLENLKGARELAKIVSRERPRSESQILHGNILGSDPESRTKAFEKRQEIRRSQGSHVQLTCRHCGKLFESKGSAKAIYCSRECYHIHPDSHKGVKNEQRD